MLLGEVCVGEPFGRAALKEALHGQDFACVGGSGRPVGTRRLTASGMAGAATAEALTPAAAPNVLTVPVRVAVTADGAVGYRELGSGQPLLLIMGLGGTMDNWSPSFVNALATEHKVVVFDNAGVGETAAISPPLTITDMADQTSALIATLHLGRPSVLGWSMGGMVAQALAVLHPSQVSRLVLAATQAGTGKAVPRPQPLRRPSTTQARASS